MYNSPQPQDLYPDEQNGLIGRIILMVIYLFVASLLSLSLSSMAFASDDFRITRASWSDYRDRLTVEGDCRDRFDVTVTNADTGASVGRGECDDHEWRVRRSYAETSSVPCTVRAVQDDGRVDERAVSNAPSDCDDGGGTPPPPTGEVSINSTSQSCGAADVSGNGIPCNDTPVPERPFVGNSAGHTVVAINDLGMHCGDLDTRISSILPPFQVLLAQVIQQGSDPEILSPNQVDVFYSAVSNPNDPILGDDSEIGRASCRERV